MVPNLIIAAIIGWCGTGWPIHFPRVGGSGGVEPGDWPPNCPMCGQFIGAISAVILVAALESTIASSGLVGLATVSFFGGSFGASLIGGLRGMSSRS
jgi:hypothetical protein